MKNLFFKTITPVMIIFLLACSGNTPEKVAKNYLKAFNKRDFEGAKKYGTEVTIKLLDMQIAFEKMGAARDVKKDAKFDIVGKKKVNDSTAVVTYKVEGIKGDQTLNLVKQSGEWKVEMSKDNLNGNPSMETGATNSDTSATLGPAPIDTTAR